MHKNSNMFSAVGPTQYHSLSIFQRVMSVFPESGFKGLSFKFFNGQRFDFLAAVIGPPVFCTLSQFQPYCAEIDSVSDYVLCTVTFCGVCSV
jgi:hypothetical protein